MNRLKVLWVTNALGVGGAERQMLYMYDIIKQYCSFDVTILYYAKVKNQLNIDGVNVHYIDKEKNGNLKTALMIAKYIKKNKFDIVHAFGGSTANIYGRIGTITNKSIPIGAMLGKKHFVRKADRIANSFLNLFGNWWTVNNLALIPILKNSLSFLDEKKIRVLHNGFVPAEAVDYKRNVNTEYDKDKGTSFVFAVVGRLEPVKNYSLFIKAARQICNTTENVRFWIIGDGNEKDNLRSLAQELRIEDRIRFWGYRDDVDVAMDRCDVFVQTSITEGSPNTIAEAMRAGKPIISTNSTDLTEMIDPRNGFVVNNNDADGLASAMNELLSKHKGEIIQMGQHSIQLFQSNFLDVNVAKEFETFYSEVKEKRK